MSPLQVPFVVAAPVELVSAIRRPGRRRKRWSKPAPCLASGGGRAGDGHPRRFAVSAFRASPCGWSGRPDGSGHPSLRTSAFSPSSAGRFPCEVPGRPGALEKSAAFASASGLPRSLPPRGGFLSRPAFRFPLRPLPLQAETSSDPLGPVAWGGPVRFRPSRSGHTWKVSRKLSRTKVKTAVDNEDNGSCFCPDTVLGRTSDALARSGFPA